MQEEDLIRFHLIVGDRDAIPFAVTGPALRDWARRRQMDPAQNLESLYEIAEEDVLRLAERLHRAGVPPRGGAIIIGSPELNGGTVRQSHMIKVK